MTVSGIHRAPVQLMLWKASKAEHACSSHTETSQIFGWAPLQLMLEEEGIYADECKDGIVPCPEQGIKLQRIYTVASCAFCFCVWPTGLVLDRCGPRVCCMMGALFFGEQSLI